MKVCLSVLYCTGFFGDGLGGSNMIVGGEVQYPGGSTHLACNLLFVVCSCLSLLVQFVAAHVLFAFGLQN
jgi:hypothetical protein